MRAFFHRLFTQESSGIAASAFIVGSASLVSRLLGMVRDRLLAGHFGAGMELDAYYAAFRIPDLLFNLFIAGALSAGFIPLFSEYLERRSEKEAWKLAAQVLTVLASIMAIVSAIFVLIAPWVIPIFIKGFSQEGIRLTVSMSRVMAISPILLGISGVMGGILQAKKRFFAFALAPVFYNLGIIIGILFFVPYGGILGVAWGVALGSLMHACIQASPAFHLGLTGIGRRPWWGEGVGRLLKMMIPRTASLAVTQMNLLIILALASSLSVGSVAVFTLATNIQSLPFGLIGVSVAVAAFPALSEAASKGADRSFHRLLAQQLAWLWFLLVPVTILFYVLAPQIIQVILGTGKFEQTDIFRTTIILQLLALALPAQSMVALLVRGFYAKQNTWTPFWISLVAEGINLALCLVLRHFFGLIGLAIGFTVSTVVNVIGLWIFLPREASLDVVDRQLCQRTIIGVLGAGGCMLLSCFFLLEMMSLNIPAFWPVVLRSTVLAFIASSVYLGLTSLFGLQEPRLIWKKVLSLRQK